MNERFIKDVQKWSDEQIIMTGKRLRYCVGFVESKLYSKKKDWNIFIDEHNSVEKGKEMLKILENEWKRRKQKP